MATQVVTPETAAPSQDAAFWRVALLMAGTVIVGTLVGTFPVRIGPATTLSDKISSAIYDFYGLPHHTATHGWYATNWWGFGLTALAAALIPLMPAWARSTQTLATRPEAAE